MVEKEEILLLTNELNKASNLYYNTGKSFLTDQEYDIKLEYLKKLEEQFNMQYPNSPTISVGAPILDTLQKIKITPKPMLSLAKVHTSQEIQSFIDNQKVIAMAKLDGLSVRLKYQDGKLVSANTRGNGEIGADITLHAKNFNNIPLTISFKDELIIDGEAIITLQDFAEINKDKKFANPRNTAAGAINALDPTLVGKRRLSFIAWDVIFPHRTESFIQNLKEIQNFGFDIVPFIENIERDSIINDINNRIFINTSKSLPCDGVVWKYDDINYGDKKGRNSKEFLNAIAWKPKIETTESHLRNIIWQGGRGNKLTPVAEFDPIEIEGSIVERASLHNYSIMKKTLGNPFVGQEIAVTKYNLIIPGIVDAKNEKGEWINGK